MNTRSGIHGVMSDTIKTAAIQDAKRHTSPAILLMGILFLVLVPIVALAQNPNTGVLLTFSDTSGNAIGYIYDSQIHSGSPRLNPCNETTDAYVMQGGSPSGCDTGDPFEASQVFGQANLTAGAYTFQITTQYCEIDDENEGEHSCSSVGLGDGCNSAGTLCASPDSGFVTVTNTSATDFHGTISLTGTSPITTSGCGTASDSTQDLASGQSVTLAVGTPGPNSEERNYNDSSNCGGYNAQPPPQTMTVPPNTTTTYSFQGGSGNGGYDYTVQNTGGTPVKATVQPIELSQSDCNTLVQFNPIFKIRRTPQCFVYDLENPTRSTSVLFALTCPDQGGACGTLNGFLGTMYNFTIANNSGFEVNDSNNPFPGWLKGEGPNSSNPCAAYVSGALFTSNQVDTFSIDPLIKGGSGGTGSCWVATYNEGDEVPPGINITTPTSTTYKYGGSVTASYQCQNPTTSNLPESTQPTGPYLTAASCSATSGATGSPNCHNVSNGIACTQSLDTLSTGPHTFTVMATDTGLNTNTKSVNYTVGKGDSSVTVTGPASHFFSYGQTVTLTATVTGGGVTPTGTVTFRTSTTQGYVLGTVTLGANGVAKLNVVLPKGNNYITATYNGDSHYSPSTSPTLLLWMYAQ